MAPTPVQRVASAFNTITSPKTATLSSVSVGDVIVVKGIDENSQTTGIFATPTGLTGSPTWATKVNIGTDNANAHVVIFTTTATANQTNAVISVARAQGGTDFGIEVVQYPAGCTVGANVWSGQTTSTGTPSVTATSIGANSALEMAITDWAAIATTGKTYRTADAGAFTETTSLQVGGRYTYYLGRYADTGAIASKTIGMSAPSGMTWTLGGVEILGPTGASAVSSLTGGGSPAESASKAATIASTLSGGGALADVPRKQASASSSLSGGGSPASMGAPLSAATPALYFNGIDAYVDFDVPSGSAVEALPNGAFTLALLVRSEGAVDGFDRAFIDHADASNASALYFGCRGPEDPLSSLRLKTSGMSDFQGLEDAIYDTGIPSGAGDTPDFVLVARYDGVGTDAVFSILERGVGGFSHLAHDVGDAMQPATTSLVNGTVRLGGSFISAFGEMYVGIDAGWDRYLDDSEVESLVEADNFSVYSESWQALTPLYLHHPIDDVSVPDVTGNGLDATAFHTVSLHSDGFFGIHYTGLPDGSVDAPSALSGGGAPSESTRKQTSPASAISGGGGPSETGLKVASSTSSLSGGGTAATVGGRQASTTTSLTGGGDVVESAAKVATPASALSSGGQPTESANKAATLASALAGGGDLAEAARKETGATSTLSGGGSTSSASAGLGTFVSSLSGGGQPVETGVKQAGAASTLSGGGDLAEATARTAPATSSLSGGGGPSTVGGAAGTFTSTLSGGGTPSTSAAKASSSSSALSGGGQAPATAQKAASAPSSLSGGGSVATASGSAAQATSSLGGGGSPSETTTRRADVVSAVAGGGDVASSGSRAASSPSSLSGGGDCASTGSAAGDHPSALTGGGQAIASGFKVVTATSSPGGGGGFTTGAARLVATASGLTGGGSPATQAGALGTISSSLSGGGQPTSSASRVASAPSSLSGGGQPVTESGALGSRVSTLSGGGALATATGPITRTALSALGGGGSWLTSTVVTRSYVSTLTGGGAPVAKGQPPFQWPPQPGRGARSPGSPGGARNGGSAGGARSGGGLTGRAA